MSAAIEIPQVGKARPFKMPPVEEVTLRNGLRVIAVRRPTVPRVEARLRIPAGFIHDRGDGARARLVAETLTTGTTERSAVEIAMDLQRLGASLGAGGDNDDLRVNGGALAASLWGLLDLMAEVVTTPSFPADEVAVARDRIAQEIMIRRSQPAGIAAEATSNRIYGKHRYGRGLPSPDAVRRIGPAPLKTFHAERVLPRGSVLVLVGDISPVKAIERAVQAFGSWRSRKVAESVAAPGPIPTGLPTLIIDRPGSVQTSIRVAGAALARTDPDYLALALANLIYGGYFSSRLVGNIREDKGYTYSPGSMIDLRRQASALVTVADVGRDVTAPSLVEIRYELGKMANLPVTQDELDAARRYYAGVTMLSVQTQAGLAAYVGALAGWGLGLDTLKGFRAELDKVSVADIQAVSARFLAPKNLLTVLVGDASVIRAQVETLDTVEVRQAPS